VEPHAKNLQQVLADKETHIGNLETHIGNVQAHTSNLEQVLADKETHIGNLETHISKLQAHTSNLEQVLADKETHIGNLETHISEVQAHTSNLQQALADKETHIGNLETHISEVQAHTSNLQQALADKETHIGNLETRANNLTQAVTLKESQIQGLEERLATIENKFEVLEGALRWEMGEKTSLQLELREIKNSLAWMSIAKYQGLRDRLLPLGTRRRQSYGLVKGALRALVSSDSPRSELVPGQTPGLVSEPFNTPEAVSLDYELLAKTLTGKKLEYRPSDSSLKIACLTWTIPYPPDSGGKNRSYNLLRYLAQHHEVHLHVPFFEASAIPSNLRNIMASITLYELGHSFSRESYRSKIIRGIPAAVAGFSTTQTVAEFQQKIARESADLILIDEAPLAPYAWPLSQIPCILMRQKVDHLYFRDVFLRAPFGKEKANALREWLWLDFTKTNYGAVLRGAWLSPK
jgi:predicted  nucleic acid-binding Zn-ribbon protein